tara:strand:+ start:1303 stop:1560 length:258 start_codon:yes stop_codon:yes gene_type:complete
MSNKEVIKKQIIYRSNHRGTKEMDLLLGSFVNKYIDSFNVSELNDLLHLLDFDDNSLSNFCINKNLSTDIPNNKISKLLKNFYFK